MAALSRKWVDVDFEWNVLLPRFRVGNFFIPRGTTSVKIISTSFRLRLEIRFKHQNISLKPQPDSHNIWLQH